MPGENRIPPPKIKQYLLDRNSPEGGPKARFFIDVCGFSPDDPTAFAEVLARHPRTAKRQPDRLTEHGPLANYVCEIDTPARGPICILSAWKRLPREAGLQLVTARPLSKPERREQGLLDEGDDAG